MSDSKEAFFNAQYQSCSANALEDCRVVNIFCNFFVIGGTVMPARKGTVWGLALASLAAFLACIVKIGKWMKLCVVLMTALFCLMKCNPIMDPVKFFIKPKCSAKTSSPIPNLSVVYTIGSL